MSESGTESHGDVENLADALLSAVEEGAEADSEADGDSPTLVGAAALAFRRLAIEFVRRYNRLEISTEPQTLTEPVLFVANHGFGGIFDLNVFAVGAAFEQLDLDRDVTILTHQLAWTLGVGPLIEPIGARPASRQSAEEAFGRGEHVAVFPGGDIDAAKSWDDRNDIKFGGRSGFARLAIDAGVPIVPIVTAGRRRVAVRHLQRETPGSSDPSRQAPSGEIGPRQRVTAVGLERRRRGHAALSAVAHQARHPGPSGNACHRWRGQPSTTPPESRPPCRARSTT